MTSTRAYRIVAVLLAWVILGGLVPGFAETGEDRVYWTDMEGIYWSNLQEGTAQRIIAADTRRPGKIAVEVYGGKMYWVDRRGGTIHWSDLDGSNSEVLIGFEPSRVVAVDLDFDPEHGKLYFLALFGSVHAQYGGVYRSNWDGSDIEILAAEVGQPSAIALDPARREMWLWDRDYILRFDMNNSKFVYRSDFEDAYGRELSLASIASRLTSSSSGFEGFPISARMGDMALDMAEGKILWTDPQERAIRRSNPDGSGVEDLLIDLDLPPKEIALDPEEGKVYWTVTKESWDRGIYAGLQRANLDGSEMEYVVERGEVVGLTLDLAGSKVYWTDARGTIHRANLDGSDVEDLFAPLVRAPYSVALDAVDGKIYWTDLLLGTVQRAGLDGRGQETIVEGLHTPKGVSLGGDRIYWADPGTGKIQSARLDGSDREDVATHQHHPDKLALDLVNRRLYWTDLTKHLIKRADLDGSNIQDSPVEDRPAGIALDLQRGRVYWTWNDLKGWPNLSRSSLEGTEIENLVTGDSGGDYRAVALDPIGGAVYWADVYSPPPFDPIHDAPNATLLLFRAELDGSNVEQVAWLSRTSDTWQRWGLKVHPWAFMGNSIVLELSHQTAVSAGNSAPISTTLGSSYPNPFNGSTLISYTLAAPGPVTLVVYNTLGQPVRTLVDKVQAPGTYSVPWQPAESLASGVYLYRLTTADAVLTRRLALLR